MLPLLLPLAAWSQTIDSPYARNEPLRLNRVSPTAASVPCFERLEVDVDATGTFRNPFDPDEVALDADITPPSGHTYRIAGYFDRPFLRDVRNGEESIVPTGNPRWRLRLTPLEEGVHHVTVHWRDRKGSAPAKTFDFTSTRPAANGFIHVSTRDRRYFEFTNGRSYFPIGGNLGWSKRGLLDYEAWMGEYQKVGANVARVLLAPSWTTFGLEQPGLARDGKGLGQFDLVAAYRLDQLLDLARDRGIYLQFCLDTYNELRPTDGQPWWEKTAHNIANGGPLANPSDFWSSDDMDRLYRMKLRYLSARYGASRNLFAWELWDEVDQTNGFRLEPVRAWHQRMGRALATLDPYDHPITTSTAQTMGIRDLELLPELSFVQTHHYGNDPAGMVVEQQSRKAAWGKPHIAAEIGADADAPRADVDTEGVQVHDPLWASVACGCAGTPMPWWWDSLVDANHLYPLFGAVQRFTDGIDFPGEAFLQTNVSVGYPTELKRPKRDLILNGRPAVWRDHATNTPRTVSERKGAWVGSPVVSELLHGVRNHPTWHNPILFKVNLAQRTKFEVDVTRISGTGGGTLRIDLDGNRLLTREFKDPDDLTTATEITQGIGVYSVEIPRGSHTIRVSNIGPDWIAASYRLVGVRPALVRPPVNAWVIVGNDIVLGWVRIEGRTWPRVAVLKRPPEGTPPFVMRVNGLASGSWGVEFWDTWKGSVISRGTVRVGLNGIARISVPSVETDMAIKLMRGKPGI